MRRLVMEIPLPHVARSGGTAGLHRVKSVEVLHFLRHDSNGFAAISKIELADDETGIDEAMRAIRTAHGRGADIQLLERRGERTYTCFMKGKLQHIPIRFHAESTRAYVTTPFELRDGNLRLTALGSAKEVKELARSIERSGIRSRVISLTDAKFSVDSPLAPLTEKQRKVLITAYNLGYYDRPRRISSRQLAKQLSLSSSTFVAHRQKAERRLLTAILGVNQEAATVLGRSATIDRLASVAGPAGRGSADVVSNVEEDRNEPRDQDRRHRERDDGELTEDP